MEAVFQELKELNETTIPYFGLLEGYDFIEEGKKGEEMGVSLERRSSWSFIAREVVVSRNSRVKNIVKELMKEKEECELEKL